MSKITCQICATFVVCFFCIGLIRGQDKNALTEIGAKDLVNAIDELEAQIFVGERLTEWKSYSNGKLWEHMSESAKLTENKFVLQQTDHLNKDSKMVSGLNSDYGFELRSNEDGKWNVEFAKSRKDLPTHFAGTERHLREAVTPQVFFGHWSVIVHAPSLQVRQIGEEIRDGLNIVILEISCDSGEWNKRSIPQIKRGTFELLKDHSFLPVRTKFLGKYAHETGFSDVEATYEYDLSDKNRPLLTKSVQEVKGNAAGVGGASRTEIGHSYQNLGLARTDSDFTLEEFGLKTNDYLSDIDK